MNFDKVYNFGFRIIQVGVKDYNGLKDLVAEIRYFYSGGIRDMTYWRPLWTEGILDEPNNEYDITNEEYVYLKKMQTRVGSPKEKMYVQQLNLDEVLLENIIPLDQITFDILHEWLASSIHPDNLAAMKHSIHEQFNPPIKYYDLSFFSRTPIVESE